MLQCSGDLPLPLTESAPTDASELDPLPGDGLISVIIPTYNAARFIERTIASVQAQTYTPLEILVVDDGSTDRTIEIVEAAAARDPRLTLIRQAHQGVAAARNRALAAARGDWIAPIDADDLWHPEKLALQVAVLRAAGSGTGLVYCWSVGIDENDLVVMPSLGKSRAVGRVLPGMIECNLPGNASTPLIRRRDLEAVGGYDPSLQAAGAQGTEDWKLYLALAEITEFALVPRHLVGYRRTVGNMSSNVAVMARSIELLRTWFIAKWPALPRRHLRRHRFFADLYLADLALGRNDLPLALRFYLSACRARPLGVIHPASLRCGRRFLARAFGTTILPAVPNMSLVAFDDFTETEVAL
ncbi:MAG TPA: glycosyltransferase family A protein [Aliidongia sp.]|nr:glycosyltransferase family A protein [Aliidongia sp.]